MREFVEHKLKIKQMNINDHEQMELMCHFDIETLNSRSQTFALSILDCTTTQEAEIFTSSYDNTNYVLAMMN